MHKKIIKPPKREEDSKGYVFMAHINLLFLAMWGCISHLSIAQTSVPDLTTWRNQVMKDHKQLAAFAPFRVAIALDQNLTTKLYKINQKVNVNHVFYMDVVKEEDLTLYGILNPDFHNEDTRKLLSYLQAGLVDLGLIQTGNEYFYHVRGEQSAGSLRKINIQPEYTESPQTLMSYVMSYGLGYDGTIFAVEGDFILAGVTAPDLTHAGATASVLSNSKGIMIKESTSILAHYHVLQYENGFAVLIADQKLSGPTLEVGFKVISDRKK